MFKKNANGDLIGYHVEGGETLKLSPYLPLNLDNLVDSKPLFLGYDSFSWFPFHLNSSDYRILEITFSEPKTREIPNFHEYQDLLVISEIYSEKYMKNICVTKLSSVGEYLNAEGFDLFCLSNSITCSGETDLLESFLMNSSKYIKQIKEVPLGMN